MSSQQSAFSQSKRPSKCLSRFHGVVNGLGHDPAIFDDERVGAVAHTRMLGFGCPFQEGDASFYQLIRVHVRCSRQLLFEQPCKLLCAFAASENASTLENDDVGGHVALDVLLEMMLAGETQMVLKDLGGGATSQFVCLCHRLPPLSTIFCLVPAGCASSLKPGCDEPIPCSFRARRGPIFWSIAGLIRAVVTSCRESALQNTPSLKQGVQRSLR